jgi:integrase
MTYCYTKGLGHRTVYDKLVAVLQMLKRYGRTKLIEPSDWPNYVEKIRVIYEPEEIQAMLRHADEDEAIFLKFMVGSGFRDREAQHVTWREFDQITTIAGVLLLRHGCTTSGECLGLRVASSSGGEHLRRRIRHGSRLLSERPG